jgi:RNA recognition motif-containing protein
LQDLVYTIFFDRSPSQLSPAFLISKFTAMNIYVSNLSFTVMDEDLKEFFAEYGEVSTAKVILDKETNRSRGFGFVEMSDDAAAQKAIAELDGAQVDGRPIRVSATKANTERNEVPNKDGRHNFNESRW